ncbi:GntR family transcriptional regulator [Sutcliffiella horikoshii]|uniref:GntR family transcriptional regulator n=1 Tax=Sutcliffiella horikoshii TaxID=79883 RepID=A0A1Y0CLE1_9BACI|nr:GntR family transcriptional regulator [Sutcliffiella horikoshii]ART75982.1 GntR family transcriptional regulator [Sutcliffiella horikoshii]TYS61250.1 GntR family transcriptional regulator [Sutcliffiella horikoshii]TYS73521.1 GntR family transcriptional regulator [Sutcliffiella horikoshii]
MTAKYDADKPIYLQIIDRISKEIVRGVLKPGDKLPSVREMAIQSGVNPNTIQRTYSEMERMEIVETKRGQGTFVTENEGMLLHLKKAMETKVVESFVQSMREIGASEREIVESVERFLEEGENQK